MNRKPKGRPCAALHPTFIGGAILVTLALALTRAAAAAPTFTESLVSPRATHFPQNAQNESPLAVNPVDPSNAISGANDEFEEPDCQPAPGWPTPCAYHFNNVVGVYVTKDGGTTWTAQVLHWQAAGFLAIADLTVTFGPKPDGRGGFSYADGARAYASAMVGSPAWGLHKVLFAVSYSDDGGSTWSPPVIATDRDSSVSFNDKPTVWADSNPSSPYFGNLYASWTLFNGQGRFGQSDTSGPIRILFTRSTDGGRTFDASQSLTPSDGNPTSNRQGSVPRTAPDGSVYVFWRDTSFQTAAILGARSTNGGVSFPQPFLVAYLANGPSRQTGDLVFPGASFREPVFPAADIDRHGNLFVIWQQYDSSIGHGVVKMARSSDHGGTWDVRTVADLPGRSPFHPVIATSRSAAPGAADQVFVGFNAIDDRPAGTLPGAGVVSYDAYYILSADGGRSFGAPVKLSARPSDPAASAGTLPLFNDLSQQFLGDYNGAAAGSDGSFWLAWTDARNGATCPAIDRWRIQGGPMPGLYTACPPDFGNTDIYVARILP